MQCLDLYDKKIRYNFGEMMPRSEFKKIRACYHNLERDLRQGGYRMLSLNGACLCTRARTCTTCT